MKKSYAILLVSVITITATLTTPLPCRAAEKSEKDIWSQDRPRHSRSRSGFKLTDERVERVMKQLAETNPQKAEQLEQWRKKSPEKFKAELRKIMREQFSRRPRRPRGRTGQPRDQKHAGYLQWLKKNYPDEAKKIAELREKNPGLHMRQLALSLKKYGRIREASEENPQLAEVLKEDFKLKKKRHDLLRKIRSASDKQEKQKLTKELERIISSRFDLIVKRRQIAYEQLRRKLEKLKDQVRKSEAELEKQKNAKFKNESLKARLEELISRTEKFEWD